MQDAPGELLANLMTEFLTLTELARLFGCNRDTMRKVIRHMPYVERIGTFYRLPIRRMPPLYFVERGLVSAASLAESADICGK